MNIVSFLIYLSSIIPSLGTAFLVLAIAGVIAAVLLVIIYFIALDTASSSCANTEDKEFPPKVLYWIRTTIITTLVLVFLSTLFPDQKTMYMIAASELGEEVIQTPEAKQLYQDLRDVLDSYKVKVGK